MKNSELAALYNGGKTITELAKLTGLARGTIHRRLSHYGVPMRPQGHPQNFTEKQEEMRYLYVDQGLSLSQVAKHLDCSAGTVARHLRIMGVDRRPAVTPKGIKTIKLTDEQIARTVALYNEGFTLREVGEQLFLSQTAVLHHLKKAGVKRRGPSDYFSHRKNEPPHQEIVEAIFLYTRMMWTAQEIAEKQGYHSHTIARRLKRAGIPIRPRSESIKLRFARRPKRATSQRST